MRQVVQLTQRGVCILRTLLHGKIQPLVFETYLQNPTQGSTVTIVPVQAVYDRNVDGGTAHWRYDLAAGTAAGVLYSSVLEALSCSTRKVTIAADFRHAPNAGPTVQ